MSPAAPPRRFLFLQGPTSDFFPALAEALHQGGMAGYGGIRIDSEGRRFRIAAARLWSLRDGAGKTCGQAACFESWWWI